MTEARKKTTVKPSHKTKRSSFTASIIVALSGFILYSDKALSLLSIQFGIPEKFKEAGMDFNTYIWLLSQTISPLLLIFGAFFKAYRISYVVPIYCYVLQLYFIFLDYKIIDDSYLQLYVLGTTMLFVAMLYTVKELEYRYVFREIEQAKNRILNYEKPKES